MINNTGKTKVGPSVCDPIGTKIVMRDSRETAPRRHLLLVTLHLFLARIGAIVSNRKGKRPLTWDLTKEETTFSFCFKKKKKLFKDPFIAKLQK